jgi:multidrug resistance efflux pump
MNKRNILIILVILVAVLAGGIWFWQTQLAVAGDEGTLEATGFIEARTVTLAPEVAGRVTEVLVEEGQKVQAGQPLVRLDEATLASQRRQAQAALQAAQAQLDLLQAGARAEEIDAAQAQLAQAGAGLQLARANLSAATSGVRPEKLSAARYSLAEAREQLQTMQVTYTSDQLEAVRGARTVADDHLAAARTHYEDHVGQDNRNPEAVRQAFAAFVEDATVTAELAEQAYEAVDDDSLFYLDQLEQVQQSRELAQSVLALARARYDGLAQDEQVTADALEAARELREGAEAVAIAAEEAYEAVTSGLSGRQLDGAWAEVQRLQATLNGYALPADNASLPALSASVTTTATVSTTAPAATASLSAAQAGVPAVEVLLAHVDAALAQRDAAAARLAALRNGARAQELEAAQAQVASAQAQLEALDVQLQKHTLAAPWDGVVFARSVEPGSSVLPGSTVMEIGRLDRLEVTVYLPEDQFGLVRLGQEAQVRVDSYPNRTFAARVLRIADEAEFTPANVQTKDSRTRLVYAVTLGLENPDLALKPGMFADVEFRQ